MARARLSALHELLPWLALGWPWAFALIAALVARAVTRRRRAEREVERIFDLAFDLLCVADTAGYFKRVNPAFERTLGYTSDELLSRPLLDFLHPDDREATRDALAGLAEGQEVRRFENRYVRRDGSVCWLEWSARPEEGVIYATARDVTDRRRAEAGAARRETPAGAEPRRAEPARGRAGRAAARRDAGRPRVVADCRVRGRGGGARASAGGGRDAA